MTNANLTRACAVSRAERISDLRYRLRLEISADHDYAVHGWLEAAFHLANADAPIAVDFLPGLDGLRASVGGAPVAVAGGDGQVHVPADRLRRGLNCLSFEFQAGSGGLHRRDGFVYSLFVPARASTTFPCFDQPDLKGRWQIRLLVPHGWEALSNGREIERVDEPRGRLVTFAETPPLSTYLVAVVAGRFFVDQGVCHGRPFRILHRESDPRRFEDNRAALIDIHAAALSEIEQYTGIAYPFDKFDCVLIPSFEFSGMEHPGAVYYNAASVLLDRSATPAEQLARANVIAHETAHMWFGNLVTMTWFDDVWMKEVFAGFLADKVTTPLFPGLDHRLRYFWQHYPGAYDVDRTQGANPIRQPLENLRDAGTLYGPIIYLKAPIVMHQLEARLSPEGLRDALREYLATFAMGNAEWSELKEILERRCRQSLAAWSLAWLEEAGRPTLAVDVKEEDGTIAQVELRQSDERGRGLVWPQRVRVLAGCGAEVHRIEGDSTEPSLVLTRAARLPMPDWILPDGERLAYGRFCVDPRTRAYLIESLHRIPDALTRAVGLLTIWEAMLAGEVSPRETWRQFLVSLQAESNPLNLERLLSLTDVLFWRIVPSGARREAAAEVEPLLEAGLTKAADAGARAAWFAALRSLAFTDRAVDWLMRLWRRDVSVPDLTLSESDETNLALDLAIRLEFQAADILHAQLARVQNPDRHERLAFIGPVLSPASEARDRFVASLAVPNNRAHEAWILDAARCSFHPVRNVPPSQIVAALSLARDFYDTGDIFFPKRWIDTILAGSAWVTSGPAVRRFIDTLPDGYPHRLRWTLLASADLLLRQADGRIRDWDDGGQTPGG